MDAMKTGAVLLQEKEKKEICLKENWQNIYILPTRP